VRHPVRGILAVAVAAVLAGARGYQAIAELGAELAPNVLRRLGIPRGSPPSVRCIRLTLQKLDGDQFDRVLSAWLVRQQILTDQPVALDGKTLRGSATATTPAQPLLSAVLPTLWLVLAQQAVSVKTNEIPCAAPLLAGLPLAGAVVTADAMHTQAATARAIVADAHADYVFTVKDNQPTLKEDIATLRLEGFPPQHVEVSKGHGRIETRAIWTSPDLRGYTAFPFAAQVFRLERTVTTLHGEAWRHEVGYGITSLAPARAGAERLLALNRGHWGIENRVRWVRDVTFDEDRSQVRAAAGPQVLASLRNLAITLLRLAGCVSIAEGLRWCTRRVARPLRLLGIALA
jgi:predicted transposase YbfD/YdcC